MLLVLVVSLSLAPTLDTMQHPLDSPGRLPTPPLSDDVEQQQSLSAPHTPSLDAAYRGGFLATELAHHDGSERDPLLLKTKLVEEEHLNVLRQRKHGKKETARFYK